MIPWYLHSLLMMAMHTFTTTISKCALISILAGITAAALYENERMEEYHRRGHKWPPQPNDYKPNTPGWQSNYDNVFHQLEFSAEESPNERYEVYMSMVHSALISQNFTEYGWGVTKAPKAVLEKLRKRLHNGLQRSDNDKPTEAPHICMETDLLPYLFDDPQMNKEIVMEMTPLMEAWSGIELVPNNAYGLRAYRNGTNLLMHLDKRKTHVISGILHVDHGENDEPWPLVIEDFHGNTNEIFLESGDLLFYESSKCRHGRPKKYNGEFYSSLFMHYYPKDWDHERQNLDIHYRIPEKSIWKAPSPRKENDDMHELVVANLCMKEPECEHGWCRLNRNTVTFNGPRPEYGKVISADGKVVPLPNIPNEESFEPKGNTYDDHLYEL